LDFWQLHYNSRTKVAMKRRISISIVVHWLLFVCHQIATMISIYCFLIVNSVCDDFDKLFFFVCQQIAMMISIYCTIVMSFERYVRIGHTCRLRACSYITEENFKWADFIYLHVFEKAFTLSMLNCLIFFYYRGTIS